ncbi:piggyBac transposable element-derived protein 4-like [Macrobrachium rosenbergii]|uniref:piggyBac transposable element-derived protein 4-like n=1 Tax=Macrobrachium rosenbergii TaxID=79674 RepID=UPI0034D584B1
MKKTYDFHWIGCTVKDIAQYLGIVMWMGIINLPKMKMFWARDKPFYSMPAFAMTMSRRKFEALGKYFHWFNRRALHKDNTDKLVLIRPVMEYIQAKCKTLYVSQKNLSLDEGMLKWKGRLSIKLYNPQKTNKWRSPKNCTVEAVIVVALFVSLGGVPLRFYETVSDTRASNAATESFIHKRRVKKQGRYELEEQHLQRPKAVGDYIAYMGGVDHFDQMINYYTFARRSRRWTKKTTLYLLQVVLLNSYVLYQKYRPDRRSKCLTFRQYHEEIATAILHFDLAMWPDSGSRIAHAPDILVEQRFDKPPPRPSPPAGGYGVVAGPAAAAPPTDTARPAAHARLGSKPDHPHRLLPTGTIVGGGVRVIHKHEKLGGVRQQRMCRVCSKNGYRRDTVYQCSYCKVALCQVTGECFVKYHNLQQYWTPRRSGDGRRARVPGRN